MARTDRRLRAAGLTGMMGGLLWMLAIFIEYGLGQNNPTARFYIQNQTLFLVVHTGWLVCAVGVAGSGAAGVRLWNKVVLVLFLLGHTLYVASQIALLIGISEVHLLLYPCAVSSAALGGTLTGLSVWATGGWQSWMKFTPLLEGTYLLLGLLAPLIVFGQHPSMPTELPWGVTWLLLGLALYKGASVLA